ncbi:MAG TPA: hypothetical protein VJ952_10430 [Opitutales bacterium]|nr:hypothetical protein [Opitutales bacterium]
MKIRFESLKAGLQVSALSFFLALSLQPSLFADTKLSEKSPFLPPGYGEEEVKPAEPVVQPQGPISREIEFRGIVQIGGVYQFSIYNKKDQKGYWLKENERQDGISVNNFEEDASTIVVLMNGRSERLTLMSASESPLPVAQAKPSTQPQARPPGLPPQLNVKSSNSSGNRKTVPRRRVILPKKN